MTQLPPGQFIGKAHPRFGLGRFRTKALAIDAEPAIAIAGDVLRPTIFRGEIDGASRVEQVSDFHCVTTWSIAGVRWSGWRFRDFVESFVRPQAGLSPDVRFVVFHGIDGYRSILTVEDLLADDVLLADRISGQPLGLEHGGPVRLVAPAHYGYKSVKHLRQIEFRKTRKGYRFPFPYPGFMDHPRARVALEERAKYLPNWLIRRIYALFVPGEVR